MEMSLRLSRSLLAALVLLALPLAAKAQHVSDTDGDDDMPHGALCGTQIMGALDRNVVLANTARANPGLYARMVERAKQGNRPSILSAAAEETHTFYVLNRVTQQYDDVEAKLVFRGRRARIWMDLRDSSRVKLTTISALARGLDTATAATSRNPNKGLIENDEDVFGMPPENQFDASTPLVQDFLLTDIQDNISGGNILGYFSPWDQSDGPGSNGMNILYIDSREGIGSQNASAIAGIISTLAHEYQHLIHYRQNPGSQIFFNEGCSETASILCGYKTRSNSYYLLGANVSMMRWSDGSVYNDLEIDYERAMTFVHYCSEQYGESFLTKLAASRQSSMNRVNDALQKIGSTADWKATLKGFMVANYARTGFADTRYAYKTTLSNTIAKATATYTDTLPATAQATVQGYAPLYYVFNFTKPSGLRVRFDASGSYAVLALLYQNKKLVEVREVPTNTMNQFASDSGYSKVVMAVVNLASSSQTVKLSTQALPSGVETVERSNGGLVISEVAPNPASGPIRMAYRTVGTAPVTVQMFDLQGRIVRTLAEAVNVEPGDHTAEVNPAGLPKS